jgi:hypothetical protein
VEELGDDDAVLVGDVDAGKGNALEEGVLAADLVVQDAVTANDLGVDVGEQAVGDPLLLAELPQDLLVVVGDRIELDARGLELRVGVAQLTELRPAGGSPHRRTVEDHHRLRAAAALVITDETSLGVRKPEVRQALAHLRSGGVSVREARASRMAERGRGVEAVVIALDRHLRPCWISRG